MENCSQLIFQNITIVEPMSISNNEGARFISNHTITTGRSTVISNGAITDSQLSLAKLGGGGVQLFSSTTKNRLRLGLRIDLRIIHPKITSTWCLIFNTEAVVEKDFWEKTRSFLFIHIKSKATPNKVLQFGSVLLITDPLRFAGQSLNLWNNVSSSILQRGQRASIVIVLLLSTLVIKAS